MCWRLHLEEINNKKKMLDKKGMENTFWVIIGAVIALVVLVVLLLIFTGKTQIIGGGLLDCQSKGGFCVLEGEACPLGTTESSVFSCPEQEGLKQLCCLGTKETP